MKYTISNLYSKKAAVTTNTLYSFIILYKLSQIEMAYLQVLNDVLCLTNGKLPTARSAAVHVCDERKAVFELCELQDALVRSWRGAAREAEGI